MSVRFQLRCVCEIADTCLCPQITGSVQQLQGPLASLRVALLNVALCITQLLLDIVEIGFKFAKRS